MSGLEKKLITVIGKLVAHLKKEKLLPKGDVKILGVSALTSLDNEQVKKYYLRENVNELVTDFTYYAIENKLDGIVCSAGLEATIVKKKYKNLFIVCPGIRLPGDKADDQSRVVTPYEALIKNKVSGIVMGRSLVRGNIKNNIKRLIDHLNQ